MALYLVTFDLHEGEERYKKIEESLSDATTTLYEKVNHNVFICKYRGLGINLRSTIESHIKKGEKLIITRIDDIVVSPNERFIKLDALAKSENINVTH